MSRGATVNAAADVVTRPSLSVAVTLNAKAPAAWGVPAIAPLVGVECDAGGQGAGGERPLVGAASTRCGEGLRKANADFAARRPGRPERRLHAQRLTDGERVLLRFDACCRSAL